MLKYLTIAVGMGILLIGSFIGLYYSGALHGLKALVVLTSTLANHEQEKQAKEAEAAARLQAEEEQKEELNPSLTGLSLDLKYSLYKLENGEPELYQGIKNRKIKYWAVYTSASWCPPCRAFTPDLVAFYNEFKPSHPNFELILQTADRSESDMFAYMKSHNMPWLAVSYNEASSDRFHLRKYCGDGIPSLALVSNDGAILSDNFTGGYHDPHDVIEAIKQQVP